MTPIFSLKVDSGVWLFLKINFVFTSSKCKPSHKGCPGKGIRVSIGIRVFIYLEPSYWNAEEDGMCAAK